MVFHASQSERQVSVSPAARGKLGDLARRPAHPLRDSRNLARGRAHRLRYDYDQTHD
jgi:hypothetical protein